jgi:hypothetical protein
MIQEWNEIQVLIIKLITILIVSGLLFWLLSPVNKTIKENVNFNKQKR